MLMDLPILIAQLSSEVSLVEAHFDNWLSGQPINENANFNENEMAVTVPEYPSNSQ